MHHFKIGWRTFKTALSVFICLLLTYSLQRETPVLACLATVYCLRTDHASTLNFSVHRLIGTFVGVLVSMLAISVQMQVDSHILWQATIGALGTILLIVICNATKHPEGIITGVSTFFIICFNTPFTETFGYAANRLIDVAIGAAVAIVVNFIMPGKKN
ncbi:FUSC family protein [Carnobacteriaceae bacterium zg-ZUI252]|nr:FUSC family protein [Carnobacteriaceae bacterium zg-ZUI252]MBS4770460.1 FUSC family protein [Carnobacteriaceae bacterium zg-ZUI240]QTU82846.1 FUSC family protein [Carnobacteriaceae bacterium zg-C25]